MVRNMKHIVKSIFVVGWYGYENTGDEAILTVLLPTLRKIFPEAEINVLSGNPSKTAKTYGVKTVGKKRKGIWKIIKTVSVSDLIVMGGGGLIEDYGNKNIVQQYRGIHRIACWLAPTMVAKCFGKQVAFYAQGVGPIHTKIGRLLTRLVVGCVDLITLRDEESKNLLYEIGVAKTQTHVTADPAFILLPSNREKIKEIFDKENVNIKHRPLIGVTVCQWQGMPNYYEQLARSLDEISEELNDKIVFIPFQRYRNGDLSGDIKTASMVLNKMRHKNNVTTLLDQYSPQEIMGIIREMDVIIGMRLHSLIFAGVMHVPMIGLKRHPKIESVLKQLSQEKYMCKMNEIDTLPEKMCALWSNKEKVIRELEVKAEVLKHKAMETSNYLKGMN